MASNKPKRNQPSKLRTAAGTQIPQPVVQPIPPIIGLQGQQVTMVSQFHQGPLPRAEDLARYEAAHAGAAERIIKMAESEIEHRRELEKNALAANIATQQRQLKVAEFQSRAIFRSDMIGQALGAVLSAGAIAGAIYCSMNGHDWFAAALISLPIVAIIRALRGNPGRPPPDSDNPAPPPKSK